MAKPKMDDTRTYLTPDEMIHIIKGVIKHNYIMAMEALKTGTGLSDASYIVPMIWGSPGIGKTRVVHEAARQAAEELSAIYPQMQELPVIVEPIADKSPEEITGYPRPDSEDTFRRLMPRKWYKYRNNPLVAFFDELAQGNTEQQNVARGATLGQQVGELKFAPGSTVIAASNLMEDRAGTHVMPTHMRDVLMHLFMRAEHKGWAMWGVANGIDPDITSFIYVHGDQYLHNLDTNSTALACPSPRSWEKANRIYKSDMGANSEHLKKAMISGTVGPAACGAFYSHLKLHKHMPDLDLILAGKPVKMEEDKADVLYMTMCALASRVEDSTMANLVKWLKTMKHKEFGSFCINMIIRRNVNFRKNPAVTMWMIENEADLIL